MFRVVALKTYPSDIDSVAMRSRQRAMQKAAYFHRNWYYFYDGYSIDKKESEIVIDPQRISEISFYDTPTTKVSVSAVVGMNGAGKSSIIDMYIRIVNNIAASVIGEYEVYPAAEHLHFIDYVYGAVAFQNDNIFYIVKVLNRNIEIKGYTSKDGVHFYQNESESHQLLKDGTSSIDTPLKPNKSFEKWLARLPYTLICNYSLYAFNYRDYVQEATNSKRLIKQGIKVNENDLRDSSFWLKGIFHKNDGYQTPIVLHPMRSDGLLSATDENELAKGRIISMLFYQDRYGDFPMRVINGTLKVVGLSLMLKTNRYYCRDTILKTIGVGAGTKIAERFPTLYDDILSFWAKKYGFEIKTIRRAFIDLNDYIVYKTLKIIRNYNQYKSIYRYLSSVSYDRMTLHERLLEILKDRSHKTTKLRRALNARRYGTYLTGDKMSWIFTLSFLNKRFDEIIEERKDTELAIDDKAELLPPPTYQVDLHIVRKTDIKKDGSYLDGDIIPFSGLSTGERQITYLLSDCMYHLANINSAWDDYSSDSDHAATIKYKYANVIFDEIELYFHPDLQRRFMYYLKQSLESVNLENIKGLNIMVVTHSPFVLSDIPRENVLCLSGNSLRPTISFGGNILELFHECFIMESTIGEVALREIQRFVETYSLIRADKQRKKELWNEKIRTNTQYLASIVSDNAIRSMIERMLAFIESITI